MDSQKTGQLTVFQPPRDVHFISTKPDDDIQDAEFTVIQDPLDLIAIRQRLQRKRRYILATISSIIFIAVVCVSSWAIYSKANRETASRRVKAKVVSVSEQERPQRPIVIPKDINPGMNYSSRGGPGGIQYPDRTRPEPDRPIENPTVPPVTITPEKKKPAIRYDATIDRSAKIQGDYYVHTISGFRVYISKMCHEQNEKNDGQPLGCLREEFSRIESIFPRKYIKQLSAVPIWIEWDHRDSQQVRTVAIYYGAIGENLLSSGIEPLKQGGCCILSMKWLYELKSQGDMDKTVLIHELSHAVHDKVFKIDNSFIINAYNQAIARRLYLNVIDNGAGGKRHAYAATNQSEYFAELSCAYLDRLEYRPHNSEELKEYDSVGYEIMERAWGSLKTIAAEKEKDLRPKPKK